MLHYAILVTFFGAPVSFHLQGRKVRVFLRFGIVYDTDVAEELSASIFTVEK
jgi:hypothetical protein